MPSNASTATESADRLNLALDDGADELITKVAKKKPTIVLLEVPGTVLTPWRDDTEAIACLFLGGERTGSAWASVLFGDVAPTGKLPITLPASVVGTMRPEHGKVPYSEGLLTSYRSPSLRAAFPFGHGLSYTRFEYTEPGLVGNNCDADTCVSVLVRNAGGRRGSEVAQAYLGFSSVPGTPKLVLRGFKRTSWLKPGDMEEVIFSFSQKDLSTYDEKHHRWVRQPSSHISVHIGASSGDIRHVLPLIRPNVSSSSRHSSKSDGLGSIWQWFAR